VDNISLPKVVVVPPGAGETEGQIGFRSDADEVVLGPGGYITKPGGQMHAHRRPAQRPGRLAAKYGLTYGNPDWLDGVVARYGLNPPTH
jgi:hypothetical protein